MDIFDSHTHLNQEDLFLNWETLLDNFVNIWGKWLVNAWANEIYNQNWILISKTAKKKHPDIFVKCILWWHPCDVERIWNNYKKSKDILKEDILNNKEYVVGIWECWIDLHYNEEWKTLELQKNYLISQCELAQELNLPIIIHSRDAFNETYEILKKFSNLKVYIHCWWYGPQEIDTMLKTFKNLYIGFCGNITYKNAENLRESAKILPIDKLLIETDAPYLSPQWFRWSLNSPERVKNIGEYVWQLLNIQEEKLREQVEKNFFNLYAS